MAQKRSQGSLEGPKVTSASQISDSGSAGSFLAPVLSSDNIQMLFGSVDNNQSGCFDDDDEDQFVDIEEDTDGSASPSNALSRETSSGRSRSKGMARRISFECHSSAIFEAFNEELDEENDSVGDAETNLVFDPQVPGPRSRCINSCLSLVSLASIHENNEDDGKAASIVNKVDRYIVNREIKNGSSIVRTRSELSLRAPLNSPGRVRRRGRRGSTNDSVDATTSHRSSRMRVCASTNDIASFANNNLRR